MLPAMFLPRTHTQAPQIQGIVCEQEGQKPEHLKRHGYSTTVVYTVGCSALEKREILVQPEKWRQLELCVE